MAMRERSFKYLDAQQVSQQISIFFKSKFHNEGGVYLLFDNKAITHTAAAAGFPLQFKLDESSNHPEAQAVGSAYLTMFSSNKTFVEKLNITVSLGTSSYNAYVAVAKIKSIL